MKITLLALLTLSAPSFADNPPFNFICGKDHYILYESINNRHAAIKNGVLMDDTKAYENPYGNDENALLIEFDQWGTNGGLHVHHFLVFSPSSKSLSLTKRTLDADNIPRSDELKEKCNVEK